jgi:hypothetical protein
MYTYYETPVGSDWFVTTTDQGETILLGTETIQCPALVEVPRVSSAGDTYVISYLAMENISDQFENLTSWTAYRFQPPFRWIHHNDEFLVGIRDDQIELWPEVHEALINSSFDPVVVQVWSKNKHRVRAVPIVVPEALEISTNSKSQTVWLGWVPEWDLMPEDEPSRRPVLKHKQI